MADWRLAKSLEKLRSQVNTARPKRSKSSDGSIGNAAHASRSSDHNPWISDGTMSVVSAIDITHDPKGGFDSYRCAEILRTKRDKRIKYVISNKRIFSATSQPWVWRAYTGSNPHSQHVHISVNSLKSQYDDTSNWDLGDMFEAMPPEVPGQIDRPILRRGDKGPAVEELQDMLVIEADGYFGPDTEAAVTRFQQARGLIVDGIVGGYTWAELEKQFNEPVTVPVNNPKQTNIVCTMFGGSADPNNSAYDEHVITDAELGCALPYRFSGTRPKVKVTNRANDKMVVCEICDVGPWNTTDNYWTLPNGRPQAESGWDLKGRKTNLAGLDITPAANAAIGLNGFGRVDWELDQPGEALPVPDYDVLTAAMDKVSKATAALAEAIAALNEVIQAMSKT